MIRFSIRLLIFSIFPILTLYGVFLLENGKADPFYRRVIGGKKKSLIIGTSKAAQGLVPSVLNTKLGLYGDDELYNFGFTITLSPFGDAYNIAIKKKIHEHTNDGIFIVTVDPWSLFSFKSDPNDRSLMVDEKLFLGKLSSVSSNINFEYLLKYYINSYWEIPTRYFLDNPMNLMESGWLMVKPQPDGERQNRVYNSRVLEYKKKAMDLRFSKYRFSKFVELINYLQKKGSVYVIAMPVDENIYQIEKAIYPEMISEVEDICKLRKIPFKDFNYKNVFYRYNDGVHLNYKASPIFSNDVANWILSLK